MLQKLLNVLMEYVVKLPEPALSLAMIFLILFRHTLGFPTEVAIPIIKNISTTMSKVSRHI